MTGFQKATKRQAKLRMALIGPSGSGKTYTALRVGTDLGKKVALIDTERGSASKYADEFAFDVLELDTFEPQQYIDAIHDAEQAGYDVLIIDSLSHAWAGKGGVLEFVDKTAKRTQSGNTFGAWREATPLQNALVDSMLGSRCHIIATMRAKTEFVQERNEQGRTTVRKVGLAPVQRDGLEFEFDVVADLDGENNFIVTKSRCKALTGQIVKQAGPEVAATLRAWLSDGAPPTEPKPRVVEPEPGEELHWPAMSQGWTEKNKASWREWAPRIQKAKTEAELTAAGKEISTSAYAIGDGVYQALTLYGKERRAALSKSAAQPEQVQF